MNSRFTKFLVCVVLLALIVCSYLLVTRYIRRNMTVDGPDMEYSFQDYELNGGDWKELWKEEPVTLSFCDDSLLVIIGEDETETSYSVGLETVYQFGEVVSIVLENEDLPFRSMKFHKEDLDGREVSFLTCYADVEGKEFVTEFVREDLEKLLPEGSYSELAD